MLKNKKNIQILVFTIIGVIALNWLGQFVYKRFDLTQDNRYTLSDAAKDIIEPLIRSSEVAPKVFLSKGIGTVLSLK